MPTRSSCSKTARSSKPEPTPNSSTATAPTPGSGRHRSARGRSTHRMTNSPWRRTRRASVADPLGGAATQRRTIASPWRRVGRYAWRQRRAVVAACLAMILDALLTVAGPWPMKVLIDNVLGAKPLNGAMQGVFGSLRGGCSRYSLLSWVIAATVILFFLGWLVGMFGTLAAVRLGQQ